MAKADLLSILYSKEKSPLEFKFDSMWIPSMYNFLTPQDIMELNHLASSAKYSSKIDFKYKEIDRIMTNRGFRKFHCGTNRIVYSYLEDQSFLVKIALDKVGLSDNPAEYRNQFLLKPFVTKVFEVSPCGTVATVERVEPITSRQEFLSVAEDIFDLMNECIIGKYVLEDVGTNYFMNWGLRKGFGAVLLDYTYVYELDGNKLFCNKIEPNTGEVCNGVIDYDNGFNNLICTKCGKRYLAKSLEQSVKDKLIILKEEGDIDMKIAIKRGHETVASFNTNDITNTIVRRDKKHNKKPLQVSVSGYGTTIGDEVDIDETIYTNDEIETTNTIKVSLSGGTATRQQPKPEEPTKQVEQKVSVSINTGTMKVEQKPVYSEETEIKVTGESAEQVEETIEDIKDAVRDITGSELVETPIKISEELAEAYETKYTRDIEVDKNSSFLQEEEKVEDMMARLGLSDKDFEEPKEEDKDEKKEDSMSKYYDEYDDEVESFQKMKKSSSKNIMENY